MFNNKLRFASHTLSTGEELILERQVIRHWANVNLEGSQLGHLEESFGSHQSQALLQLLSIGGLELFMIQWAVVGGTQHLHRYLVVALPAAPADVIKQQYLGIRKEALQVQLLVISVAGRGNGQSV